MVLATPCYPSQLFFLKKKKVKSVVFTFSFFPRVLYCRTCNLFTSIVLIFLEAVFFQCWNLYSAVFWILKDTPLKQAAIIFKRYAHPLPSGELLLRLPVSYWRQPFRRKIVDGPSGDYIRKICIIEWWQLKMKINIECSIFSNISYCPERYDLVTIHL